MHNASASDPLPRVVWCPTGPLTQLPLHAAGIYNQSGQRTFDFVVSSYTPSLSAFLRGCVRTEKQLLKPNVLIVTQPTTPHQSPLPGTTVEGIRLEEILSRSHIMSAAFNGDNACVENVRTALTDYHWIHLACHGFQNSIEPTQSAFVLHDGLLTLSALMSTVADKAELAFLSACQTATGDEKIPEESAHLAAGMLAVGFSGVVATMWSIEDADAPVVVEAYYKSLLLLRSMERANKAGTGAAHALHEAVKCLRQQVGESEFERWIPFVHYGA
jgi:CHAT domain-containing protein